MSDYHLKADIPADATDAQVDEIRAGAFKAALTHAATDPKMRLDMILGETASEYLTMLYVLRSRLAKESPEVQELARRRFTEGEGLPSELRPLGDALALLDGR